MRIKVNTRCLDDGFYGRESTACPRSWAGRGPGAGPALERPGGRAPRPGQGPECELLVKGAHPGSRGRPPQGGAGGEGPGGRGATRRWGGSRPGPWPQGAPDRRHGRPRAGLATRKPRGSRHIKALLQLNH